MTSHTRNQKRFLSILLGRKNNMIDGLFLFSYFFALSKEQCSFFFLFAATKFKSISRNTEFDSKVGLLIAVLLKWW